MKRCISGRRERLLKLYAALMERRGFSSIAVIGLAWSGFQVSWTILSAAGVVGTPLLLVLIGSSSLVLPLSLIALRQIRWAVVDSAIGASLDQIRGFNPYVIVGLGRGGAHIAAMLCHRIAHQWSVEPLFVSLDRAYFSEGRAIGARVGDVSDLDYASIRGMGKVLLVTAEVHTGNTLKTGSEKLAENGVAHETFTFMKSPNSAFKVGFYVVETDLRNILPWPSSPVRQKLLAE